jgi:hypothetical protein
MSIQPPMPPSPPLAPQASEPQNHRNAKANAKAAKAYAKAQRPWFKKKRFIGLGALVLLVVIIVLANGGSKSTPSGSKTNTSAGQSAAATKAATTATTKAAATKPTAPGGTALPIQNGDWRLDSIRIKDDGLGDFGGVARVTYTGSDTAGGGNVFTLTVFKGGKDIAVLNGSADSVAPGKQVTVQFISSDKLVAGPYTYDFQNDF